jgi:putative transposase
MRRLKYTEEQIAGILSEVETGITVSKLCQTYGISDTTCRLWKAKYRGMTASDIKRIRQLEDENRRLKQKVTELTLNNETLKRIISRNF